MNKNVHFFSKTMGIIHKDLFIPRLLFCTSNSNEGGGQLGPLLPPLDTHLVAVCMWYVCWEGGGKFEVIILFSKCA